MYDQLRRRGAIGVVGAHARQKPADVHEGSAMDFLRRHELEAAAAVKGNSKMKAQVISKLFTRTADSRNLKCAWDYLAHGDGQAPGVDGMRYDDLDRNEVWNLIRVVGMAILDDSYRTAPDRKTEIPKTSGNGSRTLHIPSVVDRMVQRAIVQTVQPFIDPLFDDHSFGYRPGRNRLHALAKAEKLAMSHASSVWITEDIKNAFDQVPINRLLDICRIHIPNEDRLRLIQRVVERKSKRGLRQGGSLSPLLLNIYLDHLLDKRWRREFPNVPLLRVADDLLVICQSCDQAQETYIALKEMLKVAGMPLKGSPETTTHSLDREPANWLGFLVSESCGLEVHLAERSWNSLAADLRIAHSKANAPLRAVEAIRGWVSQQGACYSWTDIPKAYSRIRAMAHSQAFEEIPSQEEIHDLWHRAHTRWSEIRKAMV
jgi:retron-type reverse transcriptase